MIWAQLVHIGYNMWADRGRIHDHFEYTGAEDVLRFDKSLWDDLLVVFQREGVNMVVLDLGEAIRYESHPEIAVENALSVEELRTELAKMRSMGITPVPKLNFSTSHDDWLGEYSRMVSTPKYYEVCRDLIAEVCDIFDNPELFHLGMDEETWGHQKSYSHAIVRQFDLWWHDFLFYVEEVEKRGSRAWIWSDYYWHHPELFLNRMPKSVLQSNWYYGNVMDESNTGVQTYKDLDKYGFDQVPTGSNWGDPDNFRKTVEYWQDGIADGRVNAMRLKGFLQTIWKPTLERRRQRHMEGAAEVGVGRRLWERTTE